MITVGITGGIGSGKSTVTRIFELAGVPIYIADTESKRLTESSPIIRKQLTELFGENLYNDTKLDKAKLASLIFTNKENLEKVNKIIHPEVEKDYNRWKERNSKKPILVKEAAILFESGFNKLVDKTITVYTPLDERIRRTMKRDGIERQKVLERINNQMSDEEKAKLSDFIIVNDGSRSLIEQVSLLITELKQQKY